MSRWAISGVGRVTSVAVATELAAVVAVLVGPVGVGVRCVDAD